MQSVEDFFFAALLLAFVLHVLTMIIDHLDPPRRPPRPHYHIYLLFDADDDDDGHTIPAA